MDTIFDGEVPRARLALLLRHFSELKDNREPWRIVYPLQEVLLLVTCATIASCDDFDDIVAWADAISSSCGISRISSRHSLRALAPGPPRSDRSDPVQAVSTAGFHAVAEPARIHRRRRQPSRRTHDQRKGLEPCIRSVPTPPMQG